MNTNKAQGITYHIIRWLCSLSNVVLILHPWSLLWIAEPKVGWGIWLKDKRTSFDPRGRKLRKLFAIR